jgi:hypothetical protein
MLKRSLIILAAIVVILNLTWDASAQSFLDKMKGVNVDNISETKDSEMVKAFVKVSPAGFIDGLSPDLQNFRLVELQKSRLCIERRVLQFKFSKEKDPVLKTFREEDSDDIAKKYIATAKARTHVVRLYKPGMSVIVSKLFNNAYIVNRNNASYQNNRVLMESDQSGKIVSILIRAMYRPDNYVYQYSTIYFGDGVDRNLTDRVNNSVFQEHFIKEL